MPYIYGQLFNAQLENSVGNPSSGGTPQGRTYIDISSTAQSLAKYYNGTSWVPFGNSLVTQNNTGTATFNAYGNNETIYYSAGTTLAALTLNLPTNCITGQIVRYATGSIVTSVTLNGSTVIGANVTSLTANQVIAYQAINTSTTGSGAWIRIQ